MTTDHPQEFVDLGNPGPDEAMTATSEPGSRDDWGDTGPIPLPPARPASDSHELAQESPVATPDATKPAPRFATRHGFTPSSPGNPFADPDACRVMLARYVCPYTREQHDPALPPVDIDVFGYRRPAPEAGGES